LYIKCTIIIDGHTYMHVHQRLGGCASASALYRHRRLHRIRARIRMYAPVYAHMENWYTSSPYTGCITLCCSLWSNCILCIVRRTHVMSWYKKMTGLKRCHHTFTLTTTMYTYRPKQYILVSVLNSVKLVRPKGTNYLHCMMLEGSE